MGCSTSDTPDPLVRVFPLPMRRHSSEGALVRPEGRNGTVRHGRCWPRNATHCLYHRDLRTRDELRGATWTHQQSPVRRVTKNPDRPIVQVHRVSAANPSSVPGGSPGRPPQDTRRKRGNEQRYAGWGDGIERVYCARAAQFLPGTLSCRVPRRRRHHSRDHRGAAPGSPLALHLQSPRTARLARWRTR